MNLKVINETQTILKNNKKLIDEYNKKYYQDTLDFLNLLFDENASCISRLKFTKFVLNENIFVFYNGIINKYKLNKPEFIIENYNEELIDPTDEECLLEVKKLVQSLSNNLLDKLEYKIKLITDKNTGKKIKPVFRATQSKVFQDCMAGES